MLPSVPTALSFFPEGPGGCSKFAPAGERSRAPSEEGGGGGRRGEGAGAGGGGPGGGGAGVRGLLATFLQTTLPHAESTEISGALEGIASRREGGRQPGDHTGEPPPAASSGPPRAPRVSVPRTAGSARWLPRIPHFQPPNPGFPLPLASPSAPTPGFEELLHFPKPTGAPTPALHPRPINCATPLRGKKK
ncbi:homeobox protein Hox-D11-like [Mustela nigripes]|uniref:homeobox protein Hox-D11-like n=1 Tax=Mustela nigripes TaxID=77151 RepID=UPI0028161B82|nr:homeobox protein Hox-D11-like [Mustela nigripes]